MPAADAFILDGEVAGRHAPELEARHDGLRSPVVGARIGENFVQSQVPEGMRQRRRGAFGCKAMAPSASHEAPADLMVRPERMGRGKPWHDTGVPQKDAFAVLDGPAGGAMVSVRRNIPIELGVAGPAIDGAALIGHDLAVGMHLGERPTMILAPVSKRQS
jgi:hypothetical protein